MTISIALDIDGTLSDSFGYWSTIGIKEGVISDFSGTYNGIYKVRCADGTIFADKLFNKYRDEWILGAEPYPEVANFIDNVTGNDSIKYYIVTSRGVDVKTQTLAWLAKHDITGYEDVLFLQDKTKAPTNTIIDDHPKHIKSYTDKARLAYLMSRKYNLNFKTSRRVHSLMEVYNDLLKYL